MKVGRHKIHDALACTYQCLEARTLNEALLANGISDREKRRKIIADFLFHQGVSLEQFWFKEEERRWYPGIYFSTCPLERLEQSTVVVPSRELGLNLHEYAHGAADWAIENESDPAAIETGNE